MNTKKAREMITTPGYHRNRAIDMGEMYGVWTAEWEISGYASDEARILSLRYLRKMRWHIKRITP